MIEMRIEGWQEVERKLLALERKMARQMVKDSLTEGAKAMEAPIRANISSVVGGEMGRRMINALKIRMWRRQRAGLLGMNIRFLSEREDLRRKRPVGATSFTGYTLGSASSIKSRKQVAGRRYFIPWAIEYGHAFPGRGGQKGAPKDVAPMSYFRSAYDANLGRVQRIIERRFLDELHGMG